MADVHDQAAELARYDDGGHGWHGQPDPRKPGAVGHRRQVGQAVVRGHDALALENLRPKFLAKSTMARKAADAAISATKAALGAQHNPLEAFRPEAGSVATSKFPKAGPERSATNGGSSPSPPCAGIAPRLSLDNSNAARASEVLGIRGVDLDWGDQLLRVSRKGSDDAQWLSTSADSFVWLRLYLADLGPLAPGERSGEPCGAAIVGTYCTSTAQL